MEIDCIALFVSDVNESYIFYRDVLGFKFPNPPKSEGVLGWSGKLKVGLYNKQWLEVLFDQQINQPDRSFLLSATVDDLEEAYQNLLNRSVKVLQPPTLMSWGQRVCFFVDLDGHLWEMVQKTNLEDNHLVLMNS